MRTVFWDYDRQVMKMIDQRLLPFELVVPEYETYQDVAIGIRDMVVRGAPAIGAAAGFGMALAARQSRATDRATLLHDLTIAGEHLEAARPTAVNLAWGVRRLLGVAADERYDSTDAIRDALLIEAQRLADEDVALNRRMGYHGAELIADGDTILHHCNTGALATVDWGTALGVIFAAHEQGKRVHVLVDETRPRLQGARLTAWELHERGISFDLIADNAAGHFMRAGEVDIVLVGSDRTAANGDVANKIGTYQLGVLAQANGVPFYPVVPTSTIDLDLPTGDLIPIEERDPDEVLIVGSQRIAPEGITARNPAFDVTPHRYVTGIVTEAGIVYPPFVKNLRSAVERARAIDWSDDIASL
ncbi:MAG: S-methyl-5-thioribose-1-phosphate isomerase [Anaerolineae bacterium]|nr:S-methyl-5-thioribose-1-phosphate isomerase [Anaerolineae bacterium]